MLHLKHLPEDLARLRSSAQATLSQRAAMARQALEALRQAPSPAQLRVRVKGAPVEWDGAEPLEDLPLAHVLCAPAHPPSGTVTLGVDGSQILPDRHAPLQYYVLQVGSLRFTYDGAPPQADGEASLHFEPEDLHDERDWLISARRIGLYRLVMEIEYLARQAAILHKETGQIVYAFTDGPLLWSTYGERGDLSRVQALEQRYLMALQKLQAQGGVPVGYVERPSGAPLLKLLGLPPAAAEPGPQTAPFPTPEWISDADVMALHLQPGERTPWLKRHAAAQRDHEAVGQGIAFCYFNAGRESPVIARVELPIWALGHAEVLFSILNHQTALLGGYPYLLMRAHEQAVITSEDKTYLEQVLYQVLWEQQLRPTEKARYKALLAQKARGRL